MAKFNCTATMPVLPDPATTPKTKVVAKRFFSASVGGVAVVPETEVPLDVTDAPAFPIDEDVDFELTAIHEDASGLRATKTQSGKAPTSPDTTPPDAPGDFGGIKFEAIPEEVPTPTPAPVDPAPVDPAPVDPAPVDPAAPIDPAAPTA